VGDDLWFLVEKGSRPANVVAMRVSIDEILDRLAGLVQLFPEHGAHPVTARVDYDDTVIGDYPARVFRVGILSDDAALDGIDVAGNFLFIQLLRS